MSRGEPVRYDVFVELFWIMGINPYEFQKLSGDHVMGYYPNLPSRKPKINVENLAKVLWEN